MIFSSPVPQKACTESMLFAGQVTKISCPPVVKRVINLPYDMITLLAENRQISINYNFNNPLLLSGQCDIEELLFRTGLIPLTQRFVYVSYIFYKLIFLTAKYYLVKILCFIHIAIGKNVYRQSLLAIHPLYKVGNVYTCIAFVLTQHQAISRSILCFCSDRTQSSCSSL